MAKLPTYRDLGPLPSGRSGRIIANYDTSAVGRGMADFGGAVASAAQTLGNALSSGGGGGGIGGVSQAQKFETNRRFLEFIANQQQSYEDSKQGVDPGAADFRAMTQQNYQAAAKEFFASVPDALKPEYDYKLFSVESKFLDEANAFEGQERTRYYTDAIATSADNLAKGIRQDPSSYDSAVKAGEQLIKDSELSDIDKDIKVREWNRMASLAWAETLPAEERAKLFAAGAPSNDREGYFAAIRQAESGGNDAAKNPKSSATGRYQFIQSTWEGLMKRYPEAGLTADGRTDPVQQEKAIRLFTAENERTLEGAGIPVTNGSLYAAHFLGAGGAVNVLKAGEDRKISEIVSPGTIKANPFLRSMTVADFKAWTERKAGGSGASMASSAPPEYSNRLANLTYEDTVKLGDQAQKDMITITGSVKDSFSLAIQSDPNTVDAQSIIDDPRIDDGQKATLLRELRTALKDGEDKRVAAAWALSEGAGNPYGSDDRKAAELVYKGQVDAGVDEQRAAEQIVERKGVVPKTYVDGVRNDLNSADAGAVLSGLQQAQRLKVIDRGALDGAEGGADLMKAATDFETLTLSQGYSPEDAAKRYIENRDRVKSAGYDALLKEGRKIADDIGASDIQSALGYNMVSRTIGGAPEVGYTNERSAAIIGDYQEIFVEEYTRTGDRDLAKGRADERMRKLYGVSDLFLERDVVTKFPPQNFYPPVGGSHDYIRDQAADEVEKLTGKKYPDQSVFLLPDLTTGGYVSAISGGQAVLPPYQLWYMDEKGDIHRAGAADDYFVADPKVGQEALRARITAERAATMQQADIVESGEPLTGIEAQREAVRGAATMGAEGRSRAAEAERRAKKVLNRRLQVFIEENRGNLQRPKF